MARDAEGFNTDLVRVAVTGTIYKADVGTEMPTAGMKAPEDWTPLGTFNDDGVEHEFSEDTEEVKSWQRGTVRVIVTGRTLTLKLTALESSPVVLEEFYGTAPVVDPATGTVSIAIKNSVARPKSAYLFEWMDGDAKTWRMHIPTGQVSEVESPKFSSAEAVTWGMTIQALGGSSALAEWQITDLEFAKDGGYTPLDG